MPRTARSKPARTKRTHDSSLKKSLAAIAGQLEQGQADEALAASSALLEHYSGQPGLMKLHAWALLKQEAFADAIGWFEKALEHAPRDASMHTALARCLLAEERGEEALSRLETALDIDPKRVDSWSTKGAVHRALQQIPEAVACFNEALRLEPAHLATYYNLAHLVTFQSDDPVFVHLESHRQRADASDEDRLRCAFTLGKAYLDIGDKERAFGCFAEGNALAQSQIVERPSSPESRLRFIQRHFTPALFPALEGAGLEAVPQLIISGLSRSGKSLVETLFSGVPGVEAAGETTLLSEFTREVLERDGGSLGDYLKHLTPAQCRQDAEAYLARLGGEPVQITTIPTDLWLLGLIGLWLPKVPIIFCVRDLLDQGVTCYFHHYQHMEGNAYTYDLNELGRHIGCFEQTMNHWAKVLPNPIFLVDYATLTTEPETVAENLFAALGVSRGEGYDRELERNAEQITDLSPIVSLDIPMPIRSDFNGIGHDYLPHLDPLIEGYKQVQSAFEAEEAATQPQSAPATQRNDDALGLPVPRAGTGDFNWQLPGRIVTLDNGGRLALTPRFQALVESGAFALICFDPASRLNDHQALAEMDECQVFAHAVLGDGQAATLHACLDPDMSATLAPLEASQLPPHRRAGGQVLAQLPINSIALDRIEGLANIDYLVLDALSDSAKILDHGRQALADTLLIQVGVAFQPTHERQPNLTELMHWAARNGFRFYRLHQPAYYSHLPERDDISRRQASELEHADALLVPSHARMAQLSDAQRIKLAFLLDALYEIHDLPFSLLESIDAERAEAYLEAQGYLGDGADEERAASAEAAMEAARLALSRDSVQKAFSISGRLYKAMPDDAEIGLLHAECASLLGQDGRALEVLNVLRQRQPDDVSVCVALARAQLRAGLWWEAEATLSAYAGAAEPLGVKRLLLACYLFREGQPEEALLAARERCQDLLAETPEDPEIISFDASLLAREGRIEQALARHAEALEKAEAVGGPTRARLLHAYARTHERGGDVVQACQLLWQACDVRPYSRDTGYAYKELKRLMWQCKEAEVQQLAALHQRISEIWAGYKGENLQHAFGDFGLPYQGFEPLWLAGGRPTALRLKTYALQEWLPEGARALDIGCNHGFLLLGLADRLSYAEGFDISRACVEVGKAVAEHLGIEHVHLSSQPFDQYECQAPFDLVIACAVHRWIGMPLEQFGEKLYGYCQPQGLVLLESQGIRDTERTEADFKQNAQAIASAGFDVVHTGGLCDDGVNYREFWLLRRR